MGGFLKKRPKLLRYDSLISLILMIVIDETTGMISAPDNKAADTSSIKLMIDFHQMARSSIKSSNKKKL
jgi:hypothetical protein